MSAKEIDEYITRVSNILNGSNQLNINNGPQPKSTRKTKNENNKKKSKQLFPYRSFEQLQSLCRRALILHTQGIYVRPPKSHTCEKKKKRGSKKLTERETSNGKMPKKAFGEGRVGVSCESYGVKNCTCCKHNEEDILHLQTMFKTPFNKFDKVVPEPTDYIDLTKPSVFNNPSSSNKWNDSVINISDTSLVIDPEEVITLENDLETTNTNTVIKTENIDLTTNTSLEAKNFANVDNIIDYVNLVTADYDEEDLMKHDRELEETINTEIKTEVLDPPNFANVQNISEYIDLVTTDYDEDEMRRYEEEFDITEIETTNTITENIPKIVTNAPTIQSPVYSKPIGSSSPPGLSCPICLESLKSKEPMSTICGHIFCAECIKEVIKRTKNCPNCRKKLTLKSIHPIYLG